MKNTIERKVTTRLSAITVAVSIFIAALICIAGALAVSGYKPNGVLSGDTSEMRPYDCAYGSVVEYTYGQTYTKADQKSYTLGSGNGESMGYKTALGLTDGSIVTLNSFTYLDGTDGTDETDSVRNAGTYELNVQAEDGSQYPATVAVGQAPIDFSTVDDIPVFVNAGAPKYKAHGDITSIYKHNDGWYPSQKADEVPVEIRTITNAYYYETGKEVPIKIANEVLPGNNAKSTTSTLVYKGITLNIKDRAGTVFIDPNEYIATFTFYLTDAQKANYYFDYGAATEDDEIKDSNKGLSITNRTEDSFVLSKHWFIAKYASLFVATDDTANYPFVPFHDPVRVEAAGGKTNISDGTTEGSNGETNTATDTVKYTDDVLVKIPVARFNSGCFEVRTDGKLNEGGVYDGTNYLLNNGNPVEIIKDGTIKFDVNYVDLQGKKYRIATQVPLDATANPVATNTLSYYINKTMPAGHYTVRIYGELAQNQANLNLPSGYEPRATRIQGEYWLTVLPKEINSALVNDLQVVIQGDLDEAADDGAIGIDKYFNSYALGDNKLHTDLDEELSALNGSLNDTLGGMIGKSYWSDLSAEAKTQYFDNAVTIMYNRNTWSSSNYVTEDDMVGMLTSYGTYTMYYSVSAKNYITVGGADDVSRTDYGFRTTLYMGIKVSDIYNSIITESDPYFKDVTYSGGDAKTSVSQSTYYDGYFEDEEYVNAGRHSVTLTLRNELTSWDTALPDGVDFYDYFELGGVNNSSLKVYYQVLPADNGWNVMPQMSSWAFNGFDQSVNAITAGLKFDSAVKYALIPNTVSDPDSVEWGIEGDDGEMVGGAEGGIVYFTVDQNGRVDDTTAALLNSLKPASYYLKFFVDEVTVTATDDDTAEQIKNVNAYNDVARNSAGNPLATVTVSKATNSWTSTPNVVRWTFGEYDPEIHIITAEALYPALLPKDENGDDISGFAYTAGGSTVLPTVQFVVYDGDNNVIEDLSALHAGNYTLATSMGGSDYYTAITQTRMTFTVGKAVNIWTTTPQVVQWTWGNYSADRNIISAAAKFTGGDGSQANDADKPILFTVLQTSDGRRVALTDLENFQVGDDGRITDGDAAAAFAALHAGNYYLRAEKQGNDDYTDITGSDSTDIPFSVLQATTTWQTAPNMTSWQYGSFLDGNFRGGIPTYTNTTDPITYTVTKADGSDFDFGAQNGDEFELEFAQGTLTQSMYAAFRALHVGEYKITVVQEETNDFSRLLHEIEFAVLEATNTWRTAPKVIGWTYGSFDVSYFTAGVPAFYESKDDDGVPIKVQYTLTKTGDDSFTPIGFTEFTKDHFDGLDAGGYTLTASYIGTGDYGDLESDVNFTVGMYTNSWNPSPGLRGWTYRSFTSGLFTAGVPQLKESVDRSGNAAVVTYVVTGGKLLSSQTLAVNSDGTLTADSIGFLTALEAGSYKLNATYPGTVNYEQITASIDFEVTKISNGWATSPSVIGWIYGSFDDSYFTAGVPRFAESMDDDGNLVSVEYVLSKTDDDSFTPVKYTALTKDDFNNLDAGAYRFDVYYADSDNYGELTAVVTFTVGKCVNTWSTSPGLRGWDYKNFTSSLFTAGVPTIKKSMDGDNPAAVTYEVTGGTLTSGVALAVGSDGVLSSDSVAFLTGLSVGSYTLHVTYIGTVNYDALTPEIQFNVSQISNGWSTRPRVIGWTYGSFDDSYFIAGVPTLAEDQSALVTYTLSKTGDAQFTPIEFTAFDSATFAALNVGSYTLAITYDGTVNYKEIEDEISFTVSGYTNSWNPSPSLRGWSYKNFTSGLFTAGVPSRQDDENAVVTYTLHKVTADGENTVETQIYTLTVTGGRLSDATVSYLTELGAGSYTLKATYPGTVNYGELTAALEFEVTKISNGWATRPSLLGWTYGAFAGEYFTAGVPTYTESLENGVAAKVKYTLTKDGDDDFTDILFTAIADVDLSTLDAGSYTLYASYAGTDNYEELKAEDTVITFRVSPVSNSWDKQPAITGFVYRQFSAENNFIAGVPHYPIEDKTVYYVIRTASIGEVTTLEAFLAITGTHYAVEGEAIGDITEYLGGLGNKTYYFAVFVPQANNYSYLFYTGSFGVSGAGNNWVDGVSPDISGWTYKQFDDALFTGGESEHGSVTYTVLGEDGDAVEIDEVPLDGLSYLALKAKFNSLGAGTYTLQATSGWTVDYAAIEWSKQFTVAKADNEWATDPSVSGWKYGTAHAAPYDGTVKYENAVIIGKFYPTTTDRNGNIIADTTKNEITTVVNAGIYAYVLTVKDTDNYNGFTTTLLFTVEKADNGWSTSPEGTYSWTWGDDIDALTADITNAAAVNGTVSFTIVRTDGDYTAPKDKSISELLEILPVGEYTLTATVAPSDNYNPVNPAIAYITVSAASLTITDPSCAGWTWGVADDRKVFTDIVATPAKLTDSVSVQYRVSADGEKSWTDPFTTQDGLMNDLVSRAAGDYVVEISVRCANHGDVTRKVAFTVAKAAFVWSGQQKDVGWAWNGNWTESDGGRDIPEWTATDCKGNAVTLGYTVNGAAYDGFDGVVGYLQDANLPAGTYTVKVTAQKDNHDTAEKSFTVTVSVADNEWTTEPDDSYTFEYAEWGIAGWSGILSPAAKFGTVVCKYGDTTVADVNEWIKKQKASATPYVLKFTVAASTDRYNELNKEVSITIESLGSDWVNKAELSADNQAAYTATYQKGIFATLVNGTVKFPVGNAGGTTTYCIYVDGSETADKTYTVLGELTAYFSALDAAGEYRITATYEPRDDSFSPLFYTVTVVVEKATADWSVRLEQSYAKTYNSVNLPDPETDKDFAEAIVTVKDGDGVTLDMGGKTLSEFAATLGAGTYTITATIAESGNYVVRGEQIVSVLVVSAIQNAWKDVTYGDKTITAAQWASGYTWTFTRGDRIAVMLPEAVIGGVKITFNGVATSYTDISDFNDYLNDSDLAARSYPLRFTVDATDNYTGLTCDCTLTVAKKSNAWTQPLIQSVNGVGAVDTTTFASPTADVYMFEIDGKDVDMRLYNIVKVGGAANSNWYTTADFLDELGKLTDGIFTVTAVIGGTAPSTLSGAIVDALDLYNADYDRLSCSFYVTVSKYAASWNTDEDLDEYGLVNMTWNQADSSLLPALTVKYMTATAVETTEGATVVWKIGNETLTGSVVDALNDRSAGTYTVTATYAGDERNEGLTFTATVVIEKVQTAWTDGTLGDSTTLSWTYGNRPAATTLPELEISNWAEGTIKYTVTYNGVKSDVNQADWNAYLTENPRLAAGTHTFTATVKGDTNHTDKVFTAIAVVERAEVEWSDATVNADKQPSLVLGDAITLVQPSLKVAGECTVGYTLVKVGGTGTLYYGSVWTAETGDSVVKTLASQNAGTYEITASVSGNTSNYVLPTAVTYTVTIATKQNSWKTTPDTTVRWTYKGTTNPEIVFEATYNNGLIEITVGGEVISAANLSATLKGFGVGSYSIVASVPATEEYSALEAVTVTLIIEQAKDEFGDFNVPSAWEWDDVSQKTDENGVPWQTKWNVTLKVPVPTVSTTATAIVYKGSAEELAVTLHYETVDGVKQVLTTDLNALKTKLLGLHVYDDYRIEFVVADSVDYKGCKVSADFAVTKASNDWNGAEGLPRIAGWQYDSSVANPTATPLYGKGTVRFSYAKVVGDETADDLKNGTVVLVWKDGTDTAGGTYWLRAEVPGTDDYNYLVGYAKFSISAGKNDWINNPGVIAWTWNGYNRTVNLFSGSAKNNGVATFRISAVTSGGGTRNLLASDFVFNGETVSITDGTVRALFGTNGFTLETVDNVQVVSADIAKYLNALKPGTYSLSVIVAADNNYDELRGSATFTVGKAANGWATDKAPAVSSYTHGNYGGAVSFTYGETVYGDKSAVRYRLTGTTYGDEEIDFGNEGNTGYAQIQAKLQTLPAGNYTLSAWVAESADGTYSALYSFGSPYTTRSFTVSRATNGWTNQTLVTQVNKPYAEIHATAFDKTAFAALYARLAPIDGTVNYALLNADYTSRNTDELTYDQLFATIKALPSGEYVIRATVGQTDNYTAVSAADTRLTISAHENSFTAVPDSLTAQWACGTDRDGETVNETVLTRFTVTAEYGADTVTYTLNKTTYYNYSDFEDAVSALNAGSYNVTVAIDGTDEYAGLSAVRMLTVAPAANEWKDGWEIDRSLGATDKWAWRSTVVWTKAVPLYGTTVYVEIRKAGASSALQYVTVDYGVSNGDSAAETISAAISGLDVGNYELIVSAPASVNWDALSDKTAFTVTKVSNDWTTAPYIAGAKDNKWEYGDTVIPDAEAKYGAVRYEYKTAEGDALASIPTTAGDYVIVFIVDDSDNYGGISGEIGVTIQKATNRNFSVALGTDGWTWGSYDRETNLFRGTPEITDLENAGVKFSVGTGTGESFVALPGLAEFSLNANGLVEKGSGVEAALRALTGGTSKENNRTTYTLRIHVSGTDNYNGFVQDNTFAVTGATNTWTKSPTIVPWIVNNWTDEYLPSASALYGAPVITITGEADGVVYYKGAYVEGENGMELVPETNILNLAPEGYYVMTTTVSEEIGHYNSPLLESYRFRINVKGAGEANYWEELPNINGWVANIDGQFNLPTGKPIRGLPNFVFYVRNADGTRGAKVDASLTDVILYKGDKYESDIYVPVENGDYIMVASSKGSPTEDGKSDALAEYEIRVIIDARPIAFEEETRIATLLYLGERASWDRPTAKATLADATYDFVYTNKETGETSREMPTKAGTYTVTTTITAKYAESVSMSVEFTVKLSPNSWLAAPNIKDWSEEGVPNDPAGSASVGSDEIKYTYVNVKDPDTVMTERPTSEGSYIMFADLDVEGYETLHAEYNFTIGPAFDRDLLIVDIILGTVACSLVVGVLYFAIKRYRQH